MLIFKRGNLIRYKGTGKLFVALDDSKKMRDEDFYKVTLATSLGEKFVYEYPSTNAEATFEIIAEGRDTAEM